MSEIIQAKGISNLTAGEDLDLDPGADNVVTTLQDDKTYSIKDSLGNTIIILTPSAAGGAVAVAVVGTTAMPVAIFGATAFAALGAIAGLAIDEASGSPAGNFRLFEGEIQMISEEDGSGHTKDSMVRSGNATNDSGDVGAIAGTAGGTQGNALLDGANASLNAAGTLENIGGRIIGRIAVADANHSVLEGQYLIAYTSITVTRTVTLPDPSTIPANTVFKINDESGAVTPLIKITIDTAAGNIDGVASLDITNAYGTAKVYSNGTNYFTC